jgi:hypothetical protein
VTAIRKTLAKSAAFHFLRRLPVAAVVESTCRSIISLAALRLAGL